MLARAWRRGSRAWVTGDSVYGADTRCAALIERKRSRLRPGGDQQTAAGVQDRGGLARRCAGRRLAAAERRRGAEGPALYDWAWSALIGRTPLRAGRRGC